MRIDEYQKKALSFENKDYSFDRRLENAVLGLAGEAGECADIVKKWLFQGHDLEEDKLIDELGDVAWYVSLAADALRCKLSKVLEGNLEKLNNRYPNGFEAEKSIKRSEQI